MELHLRRCPTPPWFVNRILLTGMSVLVIVDDEGEVFDYWKKTIAERFRFIELPSQYRPRLIRLSRPSELKENQGGSLDCGTLFLIDYKFKDDNVTGIALIEELGLSDKAILVTNHFEQGDVLEAVTRLRIRLMPKTYMLNVKFPVDIGGNE